MKIEEIEDQIREEFALFDNWEDRYNYIIDMGKDLPLIDPALKTDDLLIKGCQSRVWLWAEYKDGKILYTADSDAIITKGIISMLIRVLSGQKPEDIVQSQVTFIDDIGLKEHLSPTRSNGLASMIRQMKHYASRYASIKS
jgi:cysteine desulfuration protein SufE